MPAETAEEIVAPVHGPGQLQEEVRHFRPDQPVRQELTMKRREELVAQTVDQECGWRPVTDVAQRRRRLVLRPVRLGRPTQIGVEERPVVFDVMVVFAPLPAEDTGVVLGDVRLAP